MLFLLFHTNMAPLIFWEDWRFVLVKEIAEKLMKLEGWQAWVGHAKSLKIKRGKERLCPEITKDKELEQSREEKDKNY